MQQIDGNNDNDMIDNETKHHALILGDTEYTFSFPVKESIVIFGMNIGNKIPFDKYTCSVCKKVILTNIKASIALSSVIKHTGSRARNKCRGKDET